MFSPVSPPLRSPSFCYQPAHSFLHLITHAVLTTFLDIWCQRILWGGSLKRDPDPDPVTRFLSYALRRNSRTRQTASRKAQGLLKQKYTLKREVQSYSESPWGLSFSLGGGAWRCGTCHAGDIMMIWLAEAEQRAKERRHSLILEGRGCRISILPPGFGWSPVSPGREEAAQGHLLCLQALPYFSHPLSWS